MAKIFSLMILSAVTAYASAGGPWQLVLLEDAAKTSGAVCLDGSPGAFYVKWGSGYSVNKWIINLQGGGWCINLEDCYGRSKTALGSSTSYPSWNDFSSYDILSIDSHDNPDFANYTTVFIPYCDGASFSGNAEGPAYFNDTKLYFRGFRILQAVIECLLSGAPNGTHTGPSIRSASEVILTGNSAGGLATILHADFVASNLPGIPFSAMPQVGFFINAAAFGGRDVYTQLYQNVASMQNVSSGDFIQVNERCMAATPPGNRWQCFMAQYTLPFVQSRIFIQNSRYDAWQLQNILSAADVPCCNHDIDPGMLACVNDPAKSCNATQTYAFRGYATQFMSIFNTSVAAQPNSFKTNGALITSCDLHDHMVGNGWNDIKVNGLSMREIVTPWLLRRVQSSFVFDVDWPNNPTCRGPL